MQSRPAWNEVNMMIGKIFKSTLLLALAVGISACQQLMIRQLPPPTTETVVEQPPPELPVGPPAPPQPPDDISPSRRVRKALQQLEQGDYDNARSQLFWALREKPGLQIAEKLVEQLDADPVDYLGIKNFYYQVESGDSLSIIAGKFLDDPMKFVILARYNRLENPSQLAPGDRIRVPGAMPEQIWRKPKPKPKRVRKPAVNKTPPPAEDETIIPRGTSATTQSVQPAIRSLPTPPQPNLDQVIGVARKLHAGGDLSAAIYYLENEGRRFANTQALQSLQIDYNREYADTLMARGELDQARDILEKLVLLDDSNEEAVNDLIRTEDKLEGRKLYQRGSDLLNSGDVEAAYNVLTQALTYDPDNGPAKEAQLASRNKLTGSYHRQAMQHFHRQQLDEAIALWNRILAIDPQHTLAAGYKARAVEMKQKLEQIESERKP